MHPFQGVTSPLVDLFSSPIACKFLMQHLALLQILFKLQQVSRSFLQFSRLA